MAENDEFAANRAHLGGKTRSQKLTPDQRREIARKAANERWQKSKADNEIGGQNLPGSRNQNTKQDASLPKARWSGDLTIGSSRIPCYVLDDGRRVINGAAATMVLTEDSGPLEQYVMVENLIRPSLKDRMIKIYIDGLDTANTTTEGILAASLIDYCDGYVNALANKVVIADRQRKTALRAASVLVACAHCGLPSMIDQATRYRDAVQNYLQSIFGSELKKWEKSFPEELWTQFARLTNWKGSSHSRPQYWGQVVMDLIYEHLDPDVAQWLNENTPEPRRNKSYDQWLNDQFGLKKLVEHIWKVIGVASTCQKMDELYTKMKELHGAKVSFQFEVRLVAPKGTKR